MSGCDERLPLRKLASTRLVRTVKTAKDLLFSADP